MRNDPSNVDHLISSPGPDLLWDPEGAADEAGGLDEAERLPRLHHLLQARHPGPVKLPAQAVVQYYFLLLIYESVTNVC